MIKPGLIALTIATSSCLIGGLVGYMIGTVSQHAEIPVVVMKSEPETKLEWQTLPSEAIKFPVYLNDAVVASVEYEAPPRPASWQANSEAAREKMEIRAIISHYTYADLADPKTKTIVMDILSTVTHTPVTVRLPSMEIHKDKTILN